MLLLGLPAKAQNLDNKLIPTEVSLAVQKALSFFPELDNYSIEFVFKKQLKTCVMQAQPKIKTIFSKKENRHYKVIMSRNLLMKDTTMILEQLPFDILVGWFAHELGHIMDYKERTSMNLISFGFNYLTSTPFLKRSERKADSYAVKHGLAVQLIQTKNYILYKSDFTAAYKSKIEELYPSPEDITAWGEE
jgi:hypothetical protein